MTIKSLKSPPHDEISIIEPKVEVILDSFNICIASYGFLINLYPIYDKLYPDIRTPKNGLKASASALIFCGLIYISFAYVSIKCFGIENISQNIFSNLSDSGFLSQFVKVLFLLIFICAIPFNIYPLKECVINFIYKDEYISDKKHTVLVLVLLWPISATSVFVDDLRVLFGIIGAFSEAITNFILPGLFLAVTEAKLGKKSSIPLGVIFVAFGLSNFIASDYYIILKLVR